MKITVADYLVKRLRNLGIKDFFGLPGDYNFNILDSIEESEGTRWINCTNELNAGYAADGYARVNGFGALVTTFGVGELSAINAIAGSYSESVPVIKIAGTPKSRMIENNVLLHHNFQKPDYYAFERAFSSVVETTAFLDKYNAKAEIDRIIEVMVKTRKPVYVAIPVDICLVEIEDDAPEIEFVSNSDNLKKAVSEIVSIVNSSKKPVILADFIVERFGLQNEFENLIEKTKFPFATMLMGKSVIDETNENFIGTYMGNISAESTQKIMKDSDCVICLGTSFSDLNTGGFSVMPDESFKVDIQSDYTIVDSIKYSDVWMSDVIKELTVRLSENSHSYIGKFGSEIVQESLESPLVTKDIFPRLQEFLKEDDLVFIETGIISFPSGLMKLPKNCSYHSQTLWGSIGWATPAMFGGAIAAPERRPILFTGEGAHQLTMQEVANMMHFDIKPIIFVLNNEGYTIERVLSKDPMDKFNEITKWDYSKLPSLFEGDFISIQVRTSKELDEALKVAEKEQQNKLCYIEMFTDKLDVPPEALKVVENIRKNSAVKVSN